MRSGTATEGAVRAELWTLAGVWDISINPRQPLNQGTLRTCLDKPNPTCPTDIPGPLSPSFVSPHSVTTYPRFACSTSLPLRLVFRAIRGNLSNRKHLLFNRCSIAIFKVAVSLQQHDLSTLQPSVTLICALHRRHLRCLVTNLHQLASKCSLFVSMPTIQLINSRTRPCPKTSQTDNL